MIEAAFSAYLPASDLLKILVVCLAVAVVAPASVAVAIAGLDRRVRATQRHSSPALGTALVVLGVGVLAVLIGCGIYALVNR